LILPILQPTCRLDRMLEVSNPGNEGALGLDFADIYRASPLAK